MSLATETWVSVSGASVSSKAIALNNMGTNRIVVLAIHTVSDDSAAAKSVTGVADSNGLTWTRYTSFVFASSSTSVFQRLEIWWAYAAAQQTSNTVTVTLSGTAWGVNLGIGNISGVATGRFALPWDTDGSLPATNSNPSSTPADGTYTFSTHDSHDVGYAVFASVISGDSPGAPSGWTKVIDETVSNGGVGFMQLQVYIQIFASQQIGTVVDFGSQRNFGFIGAAAGGDQIFPFQQCASVGF